jgi:radical SAM superfamily enzyme YgiQ (UPF0313 family)
MKHVILCAVNAAYYHSSLSLLCLEHASEYRPETLEFTINDSVSSIVRAIAARRPDAVCFSCYIWNIDTVLRAASSIKRILPGCFILLGGPEVSFEREQLMRAHPFIDMIISGPGEISFASFMRNFNEGGSLADIPSACVRSGEDIITAAPAPDYDMNDAPFLYGDLGRFKNRIIYYETSRGCPFACAYCLSAGTGVTFLSTERVKQELEYFIKSGVRQVKLVDRTFNYPPARAKEILKTLISLSEKYPESQTNFHFEITASLLDGETLELLRSAKKGLIRIEAGIQSTHPETLRAVNRGALKQAALENLKELCRMDNIRVHADLIAGLPHESYKTFAKSFSDAYNLKPAELQLGFLKLLKGSPLRANAADYSIVCTEYAPYEVLFTDNISFKELSTLHLIERTLGMLYNSGLCLTALEHIIPYFASPFAFFEAFALFLDGEGWFSQSHKTKALFEKLYSFASLNGCSDVEIREALAFDWLCIEKPGTWPGFLEAWAESGRERLREFLSDPGNISAYLPAYARLSPGEIARRCFAHTFNELFPGKTVLFDYGKRRGDDGFVQVI